MELRLGLGLGLGVGVEVTPNPKPNPKQGDRAVSARFIRNELLWLDDEQNARRRHPDYRFG